MSTGRESNARNGLVLGVLGDSLDKLLTLVKRPDFTTIFSDVHIGAIFATNKELHAEKIANELSLHVCDSLNDLIDLPGLEMLLDMRENGDEDLRSKLPKGVCLLQKRSAQFLWGIFTNDRLCAACKDELLASRNLFNTVIDHLEEDILLLDRGGRILDMNENVSARRGKAKEEFIGLHCWELDGDGFCCKEPGGCTYKETLITGKKAERIHNLVDDQGRVRYWRVYTYPVFGDKNQMTHILEVRRDITNRTHMEMRLQQSEKLAAIGELATYIAHEIRNPLFAIGGFANSLLRSQSLDASSREKVTIVLQESKRLDTILKSILNFSRPTEAKEGQIDINQVAKDTMQLMRFGCERQNIQLELSLDPDLAMAEADPELIKQCLINLVKNAMEAMPDGGTLSVQTAMDNKFVLLVVEDTGNGIPAAIRDKVFNPFFSTKDKGSGLGLAMTKKILEDMGGRVELSSQENKGTRVTLALPPVLAVGKDANQPFTLL